MNCVRKEGTPQELFECERCGRPFALNPRGVGLPVTRRCAVDEPKYTPAPVGTNMTMVLGELAAEQKSTCGCAAAAAQMDAWGIAGCEYHRKEIVGWLENGYSHTTWLATIRAGWRGMFIINPLDPFNSLLNEAIRRTTASLNRDL